ncbi:Tetratricopeptide repeat-containing protein [Pustulibacterium marinum]|uniref:Tetratricopeptide repeat-containing protein n=1 Tax=Pustulibacterium marinum TaxID=1224947 RepID=A0A1I7F078_9FLAO|nr:alkaline phosphatase family protein [Pustulibacterium marinum]SFU29549.1 Tetratricopeptide repeat-containing protein [Pustulibacterium marinum]
MKKKTLLIGWDAADWKIIGPMLAQNELPALKKLITKGVYGNMSTMNPPYSPMLWTSVATGKTPDKHGILGFIEVAPDRKGIRPVTTQNRKVRTIWNILHHEGYRSNLVGWWPSFPAEPINGHIVSDAFQKVTSDPRKIIPFKPETTHPEELLEAIKDLKVFPFEINDEHILTFAPKAAEIDQEKDKGLVSFSKILAENISVHAAATQLMRTTEWDFMAVYYDLIDHFCHAFMKFFPPKLNAVPQKQYDIYKDMIHGAYKFQDMMLARLMELAGDDTNIIIMSDHGYESGNKRILKMPKYQAAPSLEHRKFGIFVAAGPDIKQQEKVFGLSLIDITPTLLHLFDLPIGKDMDGKPALEIFKNPKTPTYIESWETVEGDFGEHTKSSEFSSLSDQETMQQLIDLGYVDKPDEKIETAILKTETDLKHNLARVFLGKKDYESAKEVLLELLKSPKEIDLIPFYLDLITIAIREGDFKKAEKYLKTIRVIDSKLELNTTVTEAKILIGVGKFLEAINLLSEAAKTKPNPEIFFQKARAHVKLQQFEFAKNDFETALEFEQDNARYHQAIAAVYIQLGDYEEAADHALTAIELIKYFPKAHYTLGEALEKMGDLANAKIAFETAAKLQPKTYHKAEKKIENIDEQIGEIKLEDKATFKHRENQITVVSGLPRSGTSMMMQLLSNGGLEALIDGEREADVSNPKGYFEYKPVMSMHQDNSWLSEAQNKSVKIVAPLLKFIDRQFRYKVIFMNRDIHEIVRSQQKMIGKDPDTLPLHLLQAFQKQLQTIDFWKNNEPGVEILFINYKDMMTNPKPEIDKICEFLGVELDKEAMLNSIDTSLYRNRMTP